MKGPRIDSWHVEMNPSAAGHGEASGTVHTYALVFLILRWRTDIVALRPLSL